MTAHDPDVVVIGSGPNGLVSACVLARAGLDVLVLEGHPTRPGGACTSAETTLPGFVHDVGAGFFAFTGSDAFKALDLTRHGLKWRNAPYESCHPAPDGTVACLSRDLDRAAAAFGSPEDGETLRRLAAWHRDVEPFLLSQFHTLPNLAPWLKVSPLDLLRLARLVLTSGAGLSRRLFRSEAARRVIPGMAMHVDIGPEDRLGAAIGYVLSIFSTSSGFSVPVGGARAVTDALIADLTAHGGRVRLASRVSRIEVRDRRPVGVRLADGERIRVRRAVVADTSAPALYLDLLDRSLVPARVVRRMEDYPMGWGTFKVDYALSGPVPWTVPEAHESAVVHAGDSLDDLLDFTARVRAGLLPDRPYLVIGQHSLVDPSRAPEGRHTLYVYTRVPPTLGSPYPGGWPAWREWMADRIDARLEGLAPGFKERVLARSIHTPPDLEAMSPNLIGGDLGGGSNAWYRQAIFRPVFPWFRHRTPVRGVYLGSSFTHPGTGVHGMCGYNAAQAVLADLG